MCTYIKVSFMLLLGINYEVGNWQEIVWRLPNMVLVLKRGEADYKSDEQKMFCVSWNADNNMTNDNFWVVTSAEFATGMKTAECVGCSRRGRGILAMTHPFISPKTTSNPHKTNITIQYLLTVPTPINLAETQDNPQTLFKISYMLVLLVIPTVINLAETLEYLELLLGTIARRFC